MRLIAIALASLSLAACCTPLAETSGTALAECPADWPGPWTACPEADWVRRLVERAGYCVDGETGSALTAHGRSSRFYIWAVYAPGSDPADVGGESARVDGVVSGVSVYGDGVRRWWRAQDFVIYVEAGPTDLPGLPRLRGMESLIQASLVVVAYQPVGGRREAGGRRARRPGSPGQSAAPPAWADS
jgi:hypothetical protein